jgi:hypothetical protein
MNQTGRADFRHPAFRLASPRDTRRGRSGQALEAHNAEFSMNDIECKSAIAAPLHLVPSREEPAQSFKDVLIDATVCLAPRTVRPQGRGLKTTLTLVCVSACICLFGLVSHDASPTCKIASKELRVPPSVLRRLSGVRVDVESKV